MTDSNESTPNNARWIDFDCVEGWIRTSPGFGVTQLHFEAATAIVDIRERVQFRALQFSEEFLFWYRKGEYSTADLPTSSVSLNFEWSVLRDKDVGKARELIRHYRSTCLIVGEIRDEALIELLDSIPVQLLYVRSGITDKAIHAISALRSLEWLILGRGCQISDRGFCELRSAPMLQRLEISGTSIASLEASHEHGFQRLTELILDGNELNDEGFHQLSRLQRLTMLSVCRSNGPGLTAAGVADLKNLNQLEALDLTDIEIFDDSARVIAEMSHLRRLRLSGKRLTDDGVRALSLLTDLTELWFRDVVMTDQGLAALSTLKVLQFLDMRNSRITDLGIQTANLSTTLESLDLSGTSITDKALPCIAKLTGLKNLSLGSTGISDQGLRGLEGLVHLESLNVDWQIITDIALVNLAEAGLLHSLFCVNAKLSPYGMPLLRHRASRTITSMTLASCPLITDRCIPLLLSLSDLRELDLSFTDISYTGVLLLRRELQSCEIVASHVDVRLPPE